MEQKKTDANKSGILSFPVIGVGASAGGLNALHCFVGELPREFGFAVVFIQHLSMKHKSLLPDLLHTRRPDLGIMEISEGLQILPGKIYLGPPGKEVRIGEGTFHLALPAEEHVHLPIDEFFISLAEGAGGHAIAVIFSGAGTDGARGIQAVRNAGGMVFVQDPATAEFGGMPLAAIGTGQADRVLPPEEIAREILQLRGAIQEESARDISPAQLEAFSRLIQEKTGYSFNHYKKSVVSRRIRRRMYLRGISSLPDYMTLVAEKESEAANLASDLMIGVTSFFRDRLAWKALKIEVITKFAASDDVQPVRVWTPACATGEEAYSIAMALRHELDLAGRTREIQVFATDINDVALERAREGRYPGSIAADLPADYMKKFFSCSEDGLSVIISKEIRESVVFAKQDLLTDPPFSRLDLIICRNLLIYLEPEAQEKCIALFHYALKDGGFLFLGNAETPGRKGQLFKSLAHKKCRIYRKMETRQPARLSLTVPFASERASDKPSRFAAGYQESVTEFIQQKLLEESGPAAVAINHHCDILYNNGPTNRYLRQPRGAPTHNLLELLPDNVRSRVRGALYRADQEATPVSIRAALLSGEAKRRQVNVRISKMRENLFLVIFRESRGIMEERETLSAETSVDENAVHQLESELSATRADLHSNIEQLKSLNEELQSSNEELQAANEELETSREELQSLNEELITVNAQLQSKIEEQEETNNDLNNFLSSTNIPTFFLDHQLRVKRFTPAMSSLLKLIPSDVGRPIIDMSQENLGPDLIADAQSVLEHLVPIKKEIAINGASYIRAALPYRTSDNRIEGVVITYTDVTQIKKAEERTKHLASFPQFNPNPVIEVDSSGEITFANPATERILEGFGMDRGDANVFLPSDIDEILRELDKRREATLYREATVHGRIFGQTVVLTPRFNVVRIYAYDITEIKKAEQIKGRLAAIVESADDAIISKDLDGIITTWNIGAENIFGYTAEEAVGKNISFLAPPGHKDETSDILERIAKGGHIERFETERTRKDGTIIPVSLTFSPIVDADGKVIGASKIAHDITERKRAAEALQRSEAQFRTLADSVPNLAWWANDDGYITWYNRRWYEYTGTTPEQMEGWGWQSVHDPVVLPKVLVRWNESIATGEPFDMEFPLRGADGVFRPFLTRILPLKDAAGRVLRWFGTNTDISALKQAEAALLQAKQDQERHSSQLQTILDHLTEGLVVADLDQNLFHWNPAAVAMHGFSSVEECMRKLPEFTEIFELSTVKDGILPLEQWPLARILKGETLRDWEVRIRRPGADWQRVFNYGGTLARDNDGNPLLAIVTVSDITARKQAEEDIVRKANLINIAFDSIFVRDWDDRITFWNRGAEEMYGWRQEEMVGKVPHPVLQTAFPFSLEFIRAELLRTGKWQGELEHIRKNGTQLIVDSRWYLVKSAEGLPLEILEANRDITDSKRAEVELLRLNKVMKALSDSSQAVIRAKDEPQYMNDICRIVVEDCGYSMIWIGSAEDDEAKSVRPVAYSGFEQGYLKTLNLTWTDTERGRGPTGTAIRTGNVTVCRNMLTDPAFAPWREEAIKRGYASSIVFPLFMDGKVFGAMTIYSREADPFTEGEVKFLTELADNLAYGINVFRIRAAQKQAEEALRDSEQRVRRKLETVLSPEGGIGDLELGDIIDVPAIQSLVQDLYQFVHLPIGILDLKGNVLVGVGWQDVCTKFHRMHPEACRHCLESDVELTKGVSPGEFRLYKCKNGMWDAVTPILVGGHHVGNLFWGQFFFDAEPVDQDFFRSQAGRYGFNEEEYLAAVEKVPRISREALKRGMEFYQKLADMVSKLSYGNIKLARSLTERDALTGSLQRSLSRFELLTLTAGELLQSTEPQKVVESVCRKVMEFLDCHAFFNFLVDEKAERLHLNACAGIPEEEAQRIEWLDFGVAVCGCAARDGVRIIAEHIPSTPDERTELVKSYGIKAYCCHPLLGPGGKVIGTLSFGTCGRETFGEEEISLMKAVTDQVAVAMIRMRNEADVLTLGENMAERNMELESLNRELESFIYSVSHDLRAPLRTISTYAHFLLEDAADRLESQDKDNLSRITRGAIKMSGLIEDILYLSRISRLGVEREKIDMSELARSIMSDLRETDITRSVKTDIPDNVIAFADPKLMQIALSNLLGNAWKFTARTKDASIKFGTLEQDGRTVFFVKDNGAGFDKNHAEKIFWPFQRLHSVEEFEGTGIGLTIVERVVHRHGGKIWAEGESGKGAAVFFTLQK